MFDYSFGSSSWDSQPTSSQSHQPTSSRNNRSRRSRVPDSSTVYPFHNDEHHVPRQLANIFHYNVKHFARSEFNFIKQVVAPMRWDAATRDEATSLCRWYYEDRHRELQEAGQTMPPHLLPARRVILRYSEQINPRTAMKALLRRTIREITNQIDLPGDIPDPEDVEEMMRDFREFIDGLLGPHYERLSEAPTFLLVIADIDYAYSTSRWTMLKEFFGHIHSLFGHIGTNGKVIYIHGGSNPILQHLNRLQYSRLYDAS